MYDKRAEQDARRYGILDKLQALEDDLMKIPGIINVEFDVRDYGEFGRTRFVILIPKYDIDISLEPEAYFKARRDQRQAIIDTCERHGLRSSGDPIEDMGAHWYIVRSCDASWPVYQAG